MTGIGASSEILTTGLKRLEYRGYDSAGIVIVDSRSCFTRFRVANGKTSLCDLEKDVTFDSDAAMIAGIGHTRWATHGGPTLNNAHPHFDCNERVAIVHNGIVENFRELKDDLVENGHIFFSDTDTEVIAHLIEEQQLSSEDLLEAVKKASRLMRGAMSFVVTALDDPGTLIGFKRMAPMMIASKDETWFIASDIPAILDKADKYYQLDDDNFVVLSPKGAFVYDFDGNHLDLVEVHANWTLASAERSGYDDFMSKEIFEQPASLRDTLAGRLDSNHNLLLDQQIANSDLLARINKVFIVACGTSFHAGMVAKYAIEHWTKMPVELDISSEFRYRDPVVDERTLVVAISQSGETLDTLAALHEAKNLGAQTLAVCNVVASSIARLADSVLYTRAGPEVSVASTKTHTAQIGALLVLALYLGRMKGQLYPQEVTELYDELCNVPEKIDQVLKLWDEIAELASRMKGKSRFYFIGRHVGYPVALEGALKLKEISYLPAEGYPAGELKHGPIAMLDEQAVVVVIATRTRLFEKIMSNVEEVRARKPALIMIGNAGDERYCLGGEDFVGVPRVHPLFAPIIDVIPLQMFAYHMSRELGLDPDRPRNLAKTVTVE